MACDSSVWDGGDTGIETRVSLGVLGRARSKAAGGGATTLAIISGSLKYKAICLRIVEFRGPRSCCTAMKNNIFKIIDLLKKFSRNCVNERQHRRKDVNALLTVFVHTSLNTLCQSAGSTLISMRFVHYATSFRFSFAYVLAVSSDGSLKKTSASVASKNSVMFPGRMISTYFAWHIVKYAT